MSAYAVISSTSKIALVSIEADRARESERERVGMEMKHSISYVMLAECANTRHPECLLRKLERTHQSFCLVR